MPRVPRGGSTVDTAACPFDRPIPFEAAAGTQGKAKRTGAPPGTWAEGAEGAPPDGGRTTADVPMCERRNEAAFHHAARSWGATRDQSPVSAAWAAHTALGASTCHASRAENARLPTSSRRTNPSNAFLARSGSSPAPSTATRIFLLQVSGKRRPDSRAISEQASENHCRVSGIVATGPLAQGQNPGHFAHQPATAAARARHTPPRGTSASPPACGRGGGAGGSDHHLTTGSHERPSAAPAPGT